MLVYSGSLVPMQAFHTAEKPGNEANGFRVQGSKFGIHEACYAVKGGSRTIPN